MSELIPQDQQAPAVNPSQGSHQQMMIGGIHHVTMIVKDLEATTNFYRGLLGLSLLKQGRNPDDPSARHFYFGHPGHSPILSFLEYPAHASGSIGVGSIHHVALWVSSVEELNAWLGYLKQRGVESSNVLNREGLASIYLNDPDGNRIELVAQT